MRRMNLYAVCAAVLFGLVLGDTCDAARAKMHSAPPDLTQGGEPDDGGDWRLGPTGLNGWVFARSARKGGSREARQILVTFVEAGSPADGKMQLKDVILGVNGKAFFRNAREQLADAINEAEKKKGKLKLKVWRSGDELDVVLALKVMGSYSKTSPYKCKKTETIINDACAHLAKKELSKNWEGYITALGLLSTGREDVMPKIKKFAHDICIPGEVLNIETHQSMLCWTWSYKCLFLAEYYLYTGDKYVLPTLTEYATKIAMGQSGVGTWGHTVAARANTGYLHGHLGGYGAINQMGLTLMLALVLSDECGVTNDEITAAINRGEIFFSYYVDKGAIPYGDHRPNRDWFDDNGKSGSSAIMFDLLGNKRGAEFYSRMVVASAPAGREEGHTGCFWSHLWGGIGAARSGEMGLTAFLDQMRWRFDLERGWDGSLAFQGNVGGKGKKGEPKTKWDCTGPRLLQLCLPRKKLYITGKKMKVTNSLKGTELTETLAAGELTGNPEARGKLTRPEIMKLLGNRLPATRHLGVMALMEQEIKCVDDLIALLDSPNVYARYGACEALQEAGYASKKAVAILVKKIVESDDLSLRLSAIDALTGNDLKKGLANVAKPAIPTLLKLVVSRSDDDPRRLLQRKLGFALFYTGRALGMKGLVGLHGFDDMDRAVLIPAVKELLTVDDGRSRACVGSIYPKLTDADLELLWGDIYRATKGISPSGIMFADGVRISGVKLMLQHDVKEGVELATGIMSESRWGRGNRENSMLPILEKYAGDAKSALPTLKAMKPKDPAKVNAVIKAIEDGEPTTLKSISGYLGE
jgi:hypothetical protein